MASYNHAPFVGESVRSVLAQTFTDFEFLIADDGSSDDTAAVVRSFRDPRISFVAHPSNRGACVVLNELVARASGELVAVMNSDDLWAPDKLACQVKFLDGHPEYAAVFCRPSFVDANGAVIPASEVPFARVFACDNRARGAWLRRFFAAGNCLCHPSVLIRRGCYATIGPYDNRFRQLPDFDMWIRLTKAHAFFVVDRPLLSLRVLNGQNASSPTPTNVVRTSTEHLLIARTFFDGASPELIREGFGDLLRFDPPPTDAHWDIERALLYLSPLPAMAPMYQLVGLMRLFELRRSAPHQQVLEADYGIDDLEFHRLSARMHVFRPRPTPPSAPVQPSERSPAPAPSPATVEVPRKDFKGVRWTALVGELARRLRWRLRGRSRRRRR